MLTVRIYIHNVVNGTSVPNLVNVVETQFKVDVVSNIKCLGENCVNFQLQICCHVYVVLLIFKQ